MPSTALPSTGAGRSGLLDSIGFGLSVSLLAFLGVAKGWGSDVPAVLWALAVVNLGNAAASLPRVPRRGRLALMVLSSGLLLATLAALFFRSSG